MEKFTQEIKDKWLNALKSGKYVQGTGKLYNENNNTFCCIGVLGDILPDLDNNTESSEHKSPYQFLEKTIGVIPTKELWLKNDGVVNHAKDYSNVIPYIEKLKVDA